MKFKKTSIVGLALSLLLVGGVAVAFATEPVEAANEPESIGIEPVEPADESPNSAIESSPVISEPVSAPTEDEELEELLNAIAKFLREQEAEELQHRLETSVAQSDCDLRNNYTHYRHVLSYDRYDAYTHEVSAVDFYRCNDCQDLFPIERGSTYESHTFGAGTYVGSNHGSPDPSQHSFTYWHKCPLCYYECQYFIPSGCQKGHCVDINSVTPEPDVYDAAPGTSVEPADRDLDDAVKDMLEAQFEAQFKAQLKAVIEAQLKAEMEAQVYTALVTTS